MLNHDKHNITVVVAQRKKTQGVMNINKQQDQKSLLV
jgi:hypothetical protein